MSYRPYVKAQKYVWLSSDGTGTPGVALMQGKKVRAHLTAAEAASLADRLIDLTDAAGNPEPQLPTTFAESE